MGGDLTLTSTKADDGDADGATGEPSGSRGILCGSPRTRLPPHWAHCTAQRAPTGIGEEEEDGC